VPHPRPPARPPPHRHGLGGQQAAGTQRSAQVDSAEQGTSGRAPGAGAGLSGIIHGLAEYEQAVEEAGPHTRLL